MHDACDLWSASSFAANMNVKQDAIDYSHEYPMAAEMAKKAFYVGDCLTGANDSKSGLILQQQLSYCPVVDLCCKNGTPMIPPFLRKFRKNSEILVNPLGPTYE